MKVLAPSTTYRQERDPRRAPDWRYQRVRELLQRPGDHGRLHREEAYVREAARFIRRYNEAPGDEQQKLDYRRQRVYPVNPGLWHAWEFFLGIVPGKPLEVDPYRQASTPGDADRFKLRTVIEACVLARMTPRAIGNACCQLPEAIEWYERLCYDVRSRLEYSHWVRSELIGHDMLKHYAYEGGTRVLEELLSGHDATVTLPPPGQSLTSYWSGQFAASVCRRSAAANGDPDQSNRDHRQLVQVANTNSREAAKDDDKGFIDYRKNMLALLENFKILTGRTGWQQLERPITVSGIEPRVSDQFRAASDSEFAAELEAKLNGPRNRQNRQGDRKSQ